MTRLRFGTFLAPHHPVGEHPMLLFQRDLDFAAHLDRLGFDEIWVGEHHSSGWETIGSPELFLAAASQRTSQIKLATGVVSLPYHHPFMVAQRLVQLDYLSRGRVIFGSGPGALASDAFALGLNPMLSRDRQDEALGVITRLFRGERVTYECEWFQLKDAALQMLPMQEEMPMVVASSFSPSGMQLAGKYGMGVISIGSNSPQGLEALPTQWGFAEESAKLHGKSIDRNNWRVMMGWHLAETREAAEREVVTGLHRWHNNYRVGVLALPGAVEASDPWELLHQTTGGAGASGTTVIGTPDDLIAAIRNLQKITGGFGTVLGFAHDWASREATLRSWELFARYVIPELNGFTRSLRESAQYVHERREEFSGSTTAAIMAKVQENQKASAALEITLSQAAQDHGTFRPGAPDLSGVKKP